MSENFSYGAVPLRPIPSDAAASIEMGPAAQALVAVVSVDMCGKLQPTLRMSGLYGVGHLG